MDKGRASQIIKSKKPANVQVDSIFNVASTYEGPEIGNVEDRLTRFKLKLGYRCYLSWLSHYVNALVDPNVQRRKIIVGEIGCGPGYLLSQLEENFPHWEIIGVDCDKRTLIRARERIGSSSLVQGNAEELPFPDCTLDVLVILHVIEHLYHPERFAKEAARILVPKGVLLLATPNPVEVGAKIMKSRWQGWREDHVSLYTPGEWIVLVEKFGFTRQRVGTTGLSGIDLFQKFPLAVINYLPLLLFGIFPWNYGEAFVGLFKRTGEY